MTEPGITIIIQNETGTIGLIDTNNPKSDFVAEVDPFLLKQWADMVYEQFHDDDVVYLAVHRSPDKMKTHRNLVASAEYGDELQVMLCGCDCDDIKEER